MTIAMVPKLELGPAWTTLTQPVATFKVGILFRWQVGESHRSFQAPELLPPEFKCLGSNDSSDFQPAGGGVRG